MSSRSRCLSVNATRVSSSVRPSATHPVRKKPSRPSSPSVVDSSPSCSSSSPPLLPLLLGLLLGLLGLLGLLHGHGGSAGWGTGPYSRRSCSCSCSCSSCHACWTPPQRCSLHAVSAAATLIPALLHLSPPLALLSLQGALHWCLRLSMDSFTDSNLALADCPLRQCACNRSCLLI